MRNSDGLAWIFELPEHVVARVFTFLTMHDLLQTTQISKRWNSASPAYWTEVELLHRTPDNVKAKIITRSCNSLKKIVFKFYFDYLLAFKSLQHCSHLKHLTIGEGGLTWIAAATASTINDNANGKHNNTNGNHTHAPAESTKEDKTPPEEDADAKLLVAKATNAANMAADAANEANTAANAANHSVHLANNAINAAAALLAALPPGTLTTTLQSAVNAVTAAVQAANTAASAASTAANATASAANASSVAAGLAGHVVRYQNTTYLNQDNNNNGTKNSNGTTQPQSDTPAQNRGSRSPRSTAANGDSQLSAKQIKTLRITSGRSDKKIIPEYKHLYLFNNLRDLSLDGGISAPHLEGVILSARQLRSLRINCSESGNELHALRHASSLEVLKLHYFSHLFVGSVCTVPSLTTLFLQYTNHSPQIGLQQLAAALPKLHCFHLQHPSFTIAAPDTAITSELNFLCSIKNLDELDLHLPRCNPEGISELPLTSLKKLGTSMVLPVAFVQKQANLSHISLSSNHLSIAENTSANLLSLDLPKLIPQVKSLFLDGINLTKNLAAILSRLHLHRLKIHCEGVNKPELEILLQSKTLDSIDLFVDYAGESNLVIADLAKTNPDSLRHVRFAVVKRTSNLLYF